MRHRFFRDESGTTLVEILVSCAIIVIGLVAIIQAFPVGVQGMDTGRRQSTAVFLAEQKLEQIKAWSLSSAAGQGFATVVAGGACFTSVNPPGPCQTNAFNTIAGYPGYQLVSNVTNPTVMTTVVQVQAVYNHVTGRGQVTLSALLTSR